MTSFSSSRRPGADGDAYMRVSDADRHQVAEELSRHFADGRLDHAELDERMARTMAAKTRADLAGLLADLPPAPPSLPPPVMAPAAGRGRRRFPVLAIFLILLLLSGPLAVHEVFRHLAWPVLWLVAILVIVRGRPFRRGRGGLGLSRRL